ncbi:WD40-repeat-containing domain protein [Mycena crocata]|nr:WD40-repeat-containing domain protein [Mycena crocata]
MAIRCTALSGEGSWRDRESSPSAVASPLFLNPFRRLILLQSPLLPTMATYSLEKTLVPNLPGKAGAINSVLFFENGSMLASGGDDQCLRIWDIFSGDCQQEIRDPMWGQITNLSLLDDLPTQSPVLFVGSGTGVVSILPWVSSHQKFSKQSGKLIRVMAHPIESQAVDSINSRFAATSHDGHVNVYSIDDRTSLSLLWSMKLSDIPCHVAFLGDNREYLAIHTLKQGQVIFIWAQPTEQKLADDKQRELEQQRFDTQVLVEKARQDLLIEQAEKLRKEKEADEDQISALATDVRLYLYVILLPLILTLAGVIFYRLFLAQHSADHVHANIPIDHLFREL